VNLFVPYVPMWFKIIVDRLLCFLVIFLFSPCLYGQKIAASWITSSEVTPFTKAELGFNLPAFAEKGVEDFLQHKKGLNPYDPEQINAVVIFRNGSVSYSVPAFYYEEYSRDRASIRAVFHSCPEAKWNKEETTYRWRVRFAPPGEGNWYVVVEVTIPQISKVAYKSDQFTLVCKGKAENGGFLEVGNDKRHFRYSGSKKSFFMMGQDIAWPDGNRFRGGENPDYPNLAAGGYLDIIDWTKNLAANGGNTIRVVNVPWSYELEWDTVGVYRMERAWELDQLFSACENTGVKMIFCLEHGAYTLTQNKNDELNWMNHPYHKFIPGVEMPDDWLTEQNAISHYQNKLRYFIARWGYSTSLGIMQFLSEMDLWTLREDNEFKTDLNGNDGAQRKFQAWHNIMASFVKNRMPWRRILTSTSYAGPPRDYSINAFSLDAIDVIAPKHCYFTQRYDNLRRWKEIHSYSRFERGVADLFPDKPIVIDETGFGMLVGDPNDIDACNDITYHNTIWATSFMGTAGSGLYWWRWGSNEYREANYPALAAFFNDVDFEKTHYLISGHSEDSRKASKVSIETFYLISDDESRAHAIGWVHNASYWWGNISRACKDRNGKSTAINSNTGDDAEISEPQELKTGTQFQVRGLASRSTYTITYFSTREAGKTWSGGEVKTNMFGVATIDWKPGAADYGYKLERKYEMTGSGMY
jgi:hypothetical protein